MANRSGTHEQTKRADFKRADLDSPVLPHQDERKEQTVADSVLAIDRQTRAQEGTDLEVDFAVTTTLAFTLRLDTREVAHNLGRAPQGWYVVDMDGMGFVWRVPLTGKSTGQEKKLIAFKVAAETDLKVKIKVF